MCGENIGNTGNTECCISNVLQVIVTLQNRSEKNECCAEGCDKPFLGPTPNFVCFNTRPVTFYRCSDGGPWSFPYTLNGANGTNSIFRCENVEGCCATCRVLAKNTDPATSETSPYVATDSFFTVNLNCVGAIKCLPDTYVACI